VHGSTVAPLSGAHVDIWHCDAVGLYSGAPVDPMSQSEDTSGQSWLRGYQATDTQGEVAFDTIFPGSYRIRTTHIHVRIRTYDAARRVTYNYTTQFFFPEELIGAVQRRTPYASAPRGVTNRTDGIFNSVEDGVRAGDVLTLQPTGTVAQGLSARFAIGLNLEREPHPAGPHGPPPGPPGSHPPGSGPPWGGDFGPGP
jgi:protocatechuate 3,4-dioxygenase beta subunit